MNSFGGVFLDVFLGRAVACKFAAVQPLLFFGETRILTQHADSLFVIFLLMVHRLGA
jgi:hypothetical protein